MCKLHAFFYILALLAIPVFHAYNVNAFHVEDNVTGKILLDVENNGEAWYVYPLTEERFYLGRPDDAFNIMSYLGLGISDFNLGNIPRNNQNHDGDLKLRSRLAGRILLRVESRGEAWYVNPSDLKRYSLGRPADAFDLMKTLGLGIKSSELELVSDGGIVHPNLNHTVPFTAQAPLGEWSDLRQEEGCEESSAVMAVAWARGESFTLQQAKQKILAISDWEKAEYGYFVDTSAEDTAERIIDKYLGFSNYDVRYHVSASDIREELYQGNIVLATFNGKKLRNPYFRSGGPDRHMLVITGYDWANAEFITNEPGTRQGGQYRYSFATVNEALRDYTSGEYVPIVANASTAMIIIKK